MNEIDISKKSEIVLLIDHHSLPTYRQKKSSLMSTLHLPFGHIHEQLSI